MAQHHHAFGNKFLTHSGEVDHHAVYSKNLIAIYFSAHWCPPCRQFTPVLAQFYNDVKAANPNNLEVVFVSSDSSPQQFEEYFKTMPWTAVPFGDPIIQQLKTKFSVSGIPFLVVCSPHGDVITTSGRADVTNLGPECECVGMSDSHCTKHHINSPRLLIQRTQNASTSGWQRRNN